VNDPVHSCKKFRHFCLLFARSFVRTCHAEFAHYLFVIWKRPPIPNFNKNASAHLLTTRSEINSNYNTQYLSRLFYVDINARLLVNLFDRSIYLIVSQDLLLSYFPIAKRFSNFSNVRENIQQIFDNSQKSKISIKWSLSSFVSDTRHFRTFELNIYIYIYKISRIMVVEYSKTISKSCKFFFLP